MTEVFMKVDAVSKTFRQHRSFSDRLAARLTGRIEARTVRAVDRASLNILKGEVLGLVGESGCGKSTLARVLTGILPPSEGRVLLEDRPIMSEGPTPHKLDRRVQMVFQNPFGSLNPRMPIGKAISEGPVAHRLVTPGRATAYAAEWLERVGLDAAYVNRYPHQFSGGQRQRVAIARALAMQPDVLVCDEPVASLDVSIQAQIINLFLKLRTDLRLTMLFISHDLSVVRHICDRVAVMYLGRIVELADSADLYNSPAHPYTRALLESVPKLRLDENAATFHAIAGEIASPMSPPSGCYFHPRCPLAEEVCRNSAPPLIEIEPRRRVACHFSKRRN
jgi:oligopeptide/dipeptide ABC transporter ATP-binding protein